MSQIMYLPPLWRRAPAVVPSYGFLLDWVYFRRLKVGEQLLEIPDRVSCHSVKLSLSINEVTRDLTWHG